MAPKWQYCLLIHRKVRPFYFLFNFKKGRTFLWISERDKEGYGGLLFEEWEFTVTDMDDTGTFGAAAT